MVAVGRAWAGSASLKRRDLIGGADRGAADQNSVSVPEEIHVLRRRGLTSGTAREMGVPETVDRVGIDPI